MITLIAETPLWRCKKPVLSQRGDTIMAEKAQSLAFWVWLFVWATIGTAVAQWADPVFWWVGTIVAGAGAYFSYDLRETATALWTVTREVLDRDRLAQFRKKALGVLWDITCATPKAIAVVILFIVAVAVAGVAAALAPTLLIMGVTASLFCEIRHPISTLVISSDQVWAWLMIALTLMMLNLLPLSTEKTRSWLMAQGVMLLLAPLAYFFLPELVFVVILAAACWIGVMIKRILWFTLKAIHSNARVLYGLSAAGGVAIGYALGNSPIMAPLGGLAAVTIGAVELKLIYPRLARRTVDGNSFLT